MKATSRVRRASRLLFRFCVVDGSLHEARVREVAQRIALSKRRDALAILIDFRRWVRLDRDRHTAVVESASSLPNDLREEVRAGVARIYGPGVNTLFGQDPALIGGMRIRVGSDMYDGSVRARLQALAASW